LFKEILKTDMIKGERADLSKQMNLGYFQTLWQIIKENSKKKIFILALCSCLACSGFVVSLVVFSDPDIKLVSTIIIVFFIVLLLVVLFVSPLKRTQIISKLIKINKLLRIVQFISFTIALSILLILICFLDFLESDYWMFLTGFFLMVSFFFILFVSMTLSVDIEERDKVFWHLLFIHYPYLDKENYDKLFDSIQHECENNSNIINDFQDILKRLSKILESFISPKLRVKLHTSDSYNLHLSFLNNQETQKITNAFISTILELNKGNFKNFYMYFHQLVQFFRSENLSAPIDSFVFHPKASVNKFFSKIIYNQYFLGFVFILISGLFGFLTNFLKP